MAAEEEAFSGSITNNVREGSSCAWIYKDQDRGCTSACSHGWVIIDPNHDSSRIIVQMRTLKPYWNFPNKLFY